MSSARASLVGMTTSLAEEESLPTADRNMHLYHAFRDSARDHLVLLVFRPFRGGTANYTSAQVQVFDFEATFLSDVTMDTKGTKPNCL